MNLEDYWINAITVIADQTDSYLNTSQVVRIARSIKTRIDSDEIYLAIKESENNILRERLRICDRRLDAVFKWLQQNQNDVFRRGLWDAVSKANEQEWVKL